MESRRPRLLLPGSLPGSDFQGSDFILDSIGLDAATGAGADACSSPQFTFVAIST
jgi:hypothetical protein